MSYGKQKKQTSKKPQNEYAITKIMRRRKRGMKEKRRCIPCFYQKGYHQNRQHPLYEWLMMTILKATYTPLSGRITNQRREYGVKKVSASLKRNLILSIWLTSELSDFHQRKENMKITANYKPLAQSHKNGKYVHSAF